MPQGGGGVMVWAGISYGQWTQLHFIDANLNTQRYHDKIMRLIVMPLICCHHLMFQHDNARKDLYTIPGNLKMSQLFHGLHTHMSPIEHVWDALDQRVRQCVRVPANSQQLHTAIEDEWDNIPQATINSLIASMRRKCVALHEAYRAHTRYWLVFWSTPLPLRYLWPTDAYLYSQSCEIHRLGPNEFISIDRLPYMNCNSVKYLKIVACWV